MGLTRRQNSRPPSRVYGSLLTKALRETAAGAITQCRSRTKAPRDGELSGRLPGFASRNRPDWAAPGSACPERSASGSVLQRPIGRGSIRRKVKVTSVYAGAVSPSLSPRARLPLVPEPKATAGTKSANPNGIGLLSCRCVGNQRYEVGHGRAQNIEKLAQAAAAVGGLLLQFRHYQRLFLLEDLDQEQLRV
jgi:hypothetical protein